MVTDLFNPGSRRSIVVRSRIHNAVPDVVVGQIVAVLCPVKCILQDLHSGITGILEQLLRDRRESSEIFCDDRNVTELLVQVLEEIHARALHDLSVLRRLIAVRDCVIFRKSVKVVDAEHIVELHIPGNAVDPPAVSGFL